MCGFSRRFDASYRDAYNRMDNGGIGRPSIFRSQTCDKLDPSGFFVEYAQFSGGIFVDCNIHDIDLALWYFGQDSIVKSVYATGITAVQPELRKYKDVDNGVGIVEFWGGKLAYFYSSVSFIISYKKRKTLELINITENDGCWSARHDRDYWN